MTTPVVIDPFDAATEAKALFGEFFGECVLDAWNCVLEKGIGKRPFDPNVDAPDIRQTAIDIVILPISEQNLRFPLERKLLAESSAWTGITWPSLQKLGLNHAKEARNRFVKVRLAPTGRTWVGKDGQKKQETTFEFVSLFANEDECRASYLGRNGNGHAPAASSAPAAQATSPVPATNANTSDSTRTTALTFAKAIIANLARQEKDLMELQKKVSEKIATQPVVNKYFTGDSPEVMQMIAEALG